MNSKLCAKCNKIGSFNYPGFTNRLYCVNHKLEGMINLIRPVCIKCYKKATHGYPGGSRMYCQDHAPEDMINIVPKEYCLYPGCIKLPGYGYDTDNKRVYCKRHQLPGISPVKKEDTYYQDIIDSLSELFN